MQTFGELVEIIHAENGILTAQVINDMIARRRMVDEAWRVSRQINNLDNKRGYHGMGQEILSELGSDIDAFVCVAGGGGGCISGVQKF